VKIKDIIVEASLNPFKWGKGTDEPGNFATKGNYSQSEVNRFRQMLNMQSTAMGGKIDLDQLKQIAQQFAQNNYPSAGDAVNNVDSIKDVKSADAYVNTMFQTAMINRANKPKPAPTSKTTGTGTPKAEPKQDQTPAQAGSSIEVPLQVGGGARKKTDDRPPAATDAQKQALAKDVTIIQQEPIMIGFHGQKYALNDQGQWFHMNKPTVPVEQSIKAFLDKQHDISLSNT
jgi:hypothetical protein